LQTSGQPFPVAILVGGILGSFCLFLALFCFYARRKRRAMDQHGLLPQYNKNQSYADMHSFSPKEYKKFKKHLLSNQGGHPLLQPGGAVDWGTDAWSHQPQHYQPHPREQHQHPTHAIPPFEKASIPFYSKSKSGNVRSGAPPVSLQHGQDPFVPYREQGFDPNWEKAQEQQQQMREVGPPPTSARGVELPRMPQSAHRSSRYREI